MQRGITLIELMAVLALAAVLIAISYPSYASSLRKARRADAIAHLGFIELSQESWRGDHAVYGSLGDLGIAADSAGSGYVLSIASNDAAGYAVTVEAHGAQASDETCRVMRLTLSGGNTLHASGPNADAANDASANSRCWLR